MFTKQLQSQTCYLGAIYGPDVAAGEDSDLLTFRKKHTQVVISFTLITLWCKHHLAENTHVEKATDMTQNIVIIITVNIARFCKKNPKRGACIC